jgi:flagellar protein FliS
LNMNAMAYDQYKKTSIETLSPGKLLVMLYDGAIKNIDSAKKAINDLDMNTAHQQLTKTQDIITELMCTLNMDYDISHSLYSLYDYLQYRLVQANINKDVQILDEVRTFLVDLRNTWDQAAKMTGAKLQSSASASGLSIKG